MNIEQQVTNLELSQKLLTLGVKQNSLFYWADGSLVFSLDMDLLLENGKVRSLSSINNSWPDQDIFNLYSAFTVAELGEMLPSCVNDSEYWQYITNWSECCIEYKNDNSNVIAEINNKNEANARAKMLIYLLENGLMKV